jgi:Bacterial Ig domain
MKLLLPVAALSFAAFAASPALALDACNIEGTPSVFGANNTMAFDVSAQGCMHGMRTQGTLNTSEISQQAQHGTVKLTNKDTWTYVPTSGYVGPDSFAITANGKSMEEKPGTSVIQMKVNVK